MASTTLPSVHHVPRMVLGAGDMDHNVDKERGLEIYSAFTLLKL